MQQQNGENKNGLSWSSPQSQQPSLPQKPAAPAPISKSTLSMQPKLAPAQSNTAKYVGLLVVGVIAGVLIAWGWSAARNPETTATETATTGSQAQAEQKGATAAATATSSDTGSASGVATNSDPSLTVMSPQAPGSSVAIAKAIVSAPTWIVVYEDNAGQPGNALGAALFFPEKQSGSVELLRSTTAGKSYLITKQVDNGDRKFSLKGDLPLTEGGQQMWVTLEVR